MRGSHSLRLTSPGTPAGRCRKEGSNSRTVRSVYRFLSLAAPGDLIRRGCWNGLGRVARREELQSTVVCRDAVAAAGRLVLWLTVECLRVQPGDRRIQHQCRDASAITVAVVITGVAAVAVLSTEHQLADQIGVGDVLSLVVLDPLIQLGDPRVRLAHRIAHQISDDQLGPAAEAKAKVLLTTVVDQL